MDCVHLIMAHRAACSIRARRSVSYWLSMEHRNTRVHTVSGNVPPPPPWSVSDLRKTDCSVSPCWPTGSSRFNVFPPSANKTSKPTGQLRVASLFSVKTGRSVPRLEPAGPVPRFTLFTRISIRAHWTSSYVPCVSHHLSRQNIVN